jgi:D-alanyl-D-alanine carboxypeptidase
MNYLQKESKNNTYITEEYIRHIAGEARAKFSVPAIAITVMNSDKIHIKEIQGTRVIATDNTATLNNYFHIGSCSKSVLAIIAAKMIEEGMLSWDTKFFDIFPELKEFANPEYLEITLEDLFLCEAGIKAYTSGEEFPSIDSTVVNKRLEFIKYLICEVPASKKKINGLSTFTQMRAIQWHQQFLKKYLIKYMRS